MFTGQYTCRPRDIASFKGSDTVFGSPRYVSLDAKNMDLSHLLRTPMGFNCTERIEAERGTVETDYVGASRRTWNTY